MVSGTVVVLVCALWSRPIPHALKAAALGAAALSATPYALSYDYCILSMAVAFLVKDGLARGFLPGERTILMLCWGAVSLFVFVAALFVAAITPRFGEGLLYFLLAGVPLMVCTALLFMVVRRAILVQSNTIQMGSDLQAPLASHVNG